MAAGDLNLDAQVAVGLDGFRLEMGLHVSAGETVAVLGPNGAGKTTLLRALAGVVAIDEGRIAIGTQVLDDPAIGIFLPPERRPIGMVFQDTLLFPHLTVIDNVAFGLRARGASRQAARAKAGEWLGRMGLADRWRSRPGQLSGGQAQRVALARALAIDPVVLLLDEPLAALDARSRVEVRRDLQRHLRSFPGVRLLVTHDPLDALTLADRLVIIEDGAVTQTGSPEGVAARPRSGYVAELVGTNLYEGRAEGKIVHLPTGTEIATVSEARGPVYAVVPPRAVALYRQRPQGTPRNVWAGTVEHVEALANRVRVQVVGALPVVAEVTAAAVTELGLAEGQAVWVSVKAVEIEVYDA